MEPDDPAEALAELPERRLSGLELLQVAAGPGLAAYAVWALLLQPGFRRVPLRLQVRGGAYAGGRGQDWGGAYGGARLGLVGGAWIEALSPSGEGCGCCLRASGLCVGTGAR